MRELDANELARHSKDLTVLGYTAIRSLFARETLAPLRQELEAMHLAGRSTPLTGGIVVPCVQNLGLPYIHLVTSRPIEQLLMASLNDPYYAELPADRPNYILSEYIARCSAGKLRLHIDSFIPFAGRQTYMMQVAIALEDRAESDGCTVVVPGTHQRGEYTDREYQNVTPLPVKAGDVLAWDSRLWHGTTPSSDRRAWVLVATFNMWFVKPRFDATRSLPAPILAELTESQKAVLGFCSIPASDPTGDLRYRRGYEAL